MADSLYLRVRELEQEVQKLQKDLRTALDHPEIALYPQLTSLVTCPQHISLVLSDGGLLVTKKGRTLGIISLAQVGNGTV